MSSASSSLGKYGSVFDGKSFQDVNPPIHYNIHDPKPVPSTISTTATSSDGASPTIFVSIPQFRDGKRCAQTLKRLFSSATNPNRVYVGLIEQNDVEHPKDDPSCIEEYCALMGYKMKEHEAGIIHKAEKQADFDEVIENCPRVKDQIRSVRFHHRGSKGPVYARSFIRKVLGNEDFCLQIDASTDFAPGWDNLAIQQWTATGNEYAVLSNIPLSAKEKKRKEKSGINNVEVPRQCSIKIGSEGVPLYENVADGKAIGLSQPLLSTAYSPSFAFARCHYETNVPHDPFAVQLLETEKFPKYARMWTRGYDVYTPSVNIVYKDNAILHPLHQTAGHGEAGEKKWPKNDNERRDAHIRMKVLLDIHHGITRDEAAMLGAGNSIGGKIATARANLGIYGLGKRRSLTQLLEFVGIALLSSDFTGQHGHDGAGCAHPTWVPYDASISPKANLFDETGKADDIDLYPVFPLRTLSDASGEQYDHPSVNNGNEALADLQEKTNINSFQEATSDVPYATVFLLWAIGLCVWYGMYIGGESSSQMTRKGVNKQSRSSITKKKTTTRPLRERAVLKNV